VRSGEHLTTVTDVQELYRTLLDRWNQRDAEGYGELFTDDGSVVDFDGSTLSSSGSITEHLRGIFEDHTPATYVAKVREVREIGAGAMLLRGVAGKVPPDQDDINPDVNAIQTMVAVETGQGWRVAHFQNTPAAFDGRPEEAKALTAELREELHRHS
jgi:uncharacterized protein (TIGR02246 family)